MTQTGLDGWFLKQFLHVSSWQRLSSSRWHLVLNMHGRLVISTSDVIMFILFPHSPLTGHFFQGIHCSRVLLWAISLVESLWRAANWGIDLRRSWTKRLQRLHSYVTMRYCYHVWSCWQQVLSFMCSCVTVLLISPDVLQCCRSCFGFGIKLFVFVIEPRSLWLS